ESFLQEIKATAEKSVQQQPVQAAQKKSPLTEEQRQLVLRNSRAAMSSPAAAASIAADSPKTPQELAQLIQEGQASRCGVTTSPPGAEVYIDGNKAGAAPLGFVLLKHGDTPRIITIKMQRYTSVERQYIPDGKIIPVAVILERESSAEVSGGHEQPPQNTPTVLADEPQYINSFYALDASGKLLELEHTRVAFHSKVRAVPGYASAKTSAEIKPGQSPVRLPANAQFILRGRSLMDPASRYELRLLKSSKSHREFALIHAHGSAFIFGASGGGSGVSEGAVPIQFEEYGRYSYRITPAQPLAPGEYALSVRGLVSEVYCFGVDQ
ncbi:MAG: PEGA domain-containing protein, partial [Candidatus Korobacteraceae bacterium]